MWVTPFYQITAGAATDPVAESVHSALVSAVSKAEMSDLTESLAPKSIQKALPTE